MGGGFRIAGHLPACSLLPATDQEPRRAPAHTHEAAAAGANLTTPNGKMTESFRIHASRFLCSDGDCACTSPQSAGRLVRPPGCPHHRITNEGPALISPLSPSLPLCCCASSVYIIPTSLPAVTLSSSSPTPIYIYHIPSRPPIPTDPDHPLINQLSNQPTILQHSPVPDLICSRSRSVNTLLLIYSASTQPSSRPPSCC